MRDLLFGAPAGDPREMFDHVYAAPTPLLEARAGDPRAGADGCGRGRADGADHGRRAQCGAARLDARGRLRGGLRRGCRQARRCLPHHRRAPGGDGRSTAVSTRRSPSRASPEPPSAWRSTGMRPVVEMQFDGFSYPALNQVISHVAKYRNRTRGRVGLPMVIRIPYGGRHRRGRASLGEPRGLLRAHGRADGRLARDAGRRLRAAPRIDRVRRPGDLPRAEASVLAEGGPRPAGHRPADREGARPPRRDHGDGHRLRTDGDHRAGGGHARRRREWLGPRGRRRRARSRRSTWTRWWPAPPRRGGRWWCTRRRGSPATARRSPPS